MKYFFFFFKNAPLYPQMQMLSWQNALLQKDMNKIILSSGVGGHFWENKCEMPFWLFKNNLLYSLIKCSYWKCPFEKGHLNKGILSRDIWGHFWKGKRAFLPKRQKPQSQPVPQNCYRPFSHKWFLEFKFFYIMILFSQQRKETLYYYVSQCLLRKEDHQRVIVDPMLLID